MGTADNGSGKPASTSSPTSSSSSTSTRYIFEALESIRLAKFSEESFEYENASRLYDTAVHLFITGVQKDPNKERQDLVRKKLAKCLAKAEKCRAIVRSKGKNNNNSNTTTTSENTNFDNNNDEDEDLQHIPESLTNSTDSFNSSYDFLNSSSISKHFCSNSSNIDWPHNLNHYQLKQVITSDIWLVARLIDKTDQNLAIMVGVPRNNNNQNNSSIQPSSISNQETLETIDTSTIPHYELGKALSLRIAAIMYRPNRYHITTGQKFLQEFITDIALEIRTQYTIFCIVRANKETLEYARSVRKIVTNMRHSGCKSIETMCQACQLRQTQRNIIRFSSSSGTSSSSDDGESRKIKFKKKSSDYRRESKNTVRKLSQEEVRKSLQKKLESTESGLSSGQSGKNIVGIQKNTSSVQQKPEKTSSAKPISSNKRRVSTICG